MLARPRIFFLSVVLITVIGFPIFGQSQAGKGVVILQDDEVIFGHVEYHQGHELITVTRGEKQLTYASFQVKIFQYYDIEKSLNRVYQPFILESNKRYAYQKEVPGFFEMVIAEDVMILRKQKTILVEPVRRDEKGSIMAYNLGSTPVEAISHDYYVSTDGERVALLTDFEKQVISKLDKSFIAVLDHYIVEHNLDLDVWKDQFELLTYYQELKSGNPGPKLISKAGISQKSF